MKVTTSIIGALLLAAFLPSCKESADPKMGIGPIKKLDIAATIDPGMAADGAKLFQAKCSACHEMAARKVGPALYEVTKRRAPEWIMNMILNPSEMTKSDPQAMELFSTYLVEMTFQNVSEEEARKMLEYFRETDSKPLASGATDAPKPTEK